MNQATRAVREKHLLDRILVDDVDIEEVKAWLDDSFKVRERTLYMQRTN